MAEYSKIEQEINGYKRILEMSTPFDRRHPDPSRNYGIHGISLRCVLLKNKRAVQFVAYLPVYLPHVSRELWQKSNRQYNPFKGMGADVGYHSPTPMFKGQTTMPNCPYIEGECYYDGSSLRADEWYKEFLRFGLNHIWEKLEEAWIEFFENPEMEKSE